MVAEEEMSFLVQDEGSGAAPFFANILWHMKALKDSLVRQTTNQLQTKCNKNH